MSSSQHTDTPPGLDIERFTEWFEQACPGQASGPLHASVIAGGRSNLTYELSDGTSSWVVRRPPLGHVLATAHDMSREYREVSALRDTEVPVPVTYALCEDSEVIGAPFYVMELIAGTPYRFAAQLNELGPQRTRVIADRMMDTLAELHQVDPEAVGLADFGRPQGFLARQVRRWKKQLDASSSRDLAGMDELHERLATDPPEGAEASVVHGDYRLDNILVDDHDQPVAVVDWEMATLADPLTDVALLAVYHRLGLSDSTVVSNAPKAAGHPTERELLDRYAAASGRDLSDLGFHIGLASFKIAVILEGIHYRYTQGQTVGEGFEHVGSFVEPLVDAGLTALKERR